MVTLTMILGLTVAYIAYLASLIVYRLWLSPLAKFPGPKLAAISGWYEFYWDVVQPGQMTFHLTKLHARYGPIIRIAPGDLHILDSSFFDELYNRPGAVRHKSPTFSGRFGFQSDCFSTWQHDVHRLRRTALNPFFSAKRIASLQPMVREKLTNLTKALVRSHEIGSIVPLNLGYSALTADVVVQYAFNTSYNQLDSPGFSENYDEALKSLYVVSNLALHFPFVFNILNATPRPITALLNPVVLPVVDFHADCRRSVSKAKDELEQGTKFDDNPTVFHELLRTEALPTHEKTEKRLTDEAIEIIAAGIITTSSTLSTGTCHILSDPIIRKRLVEELDQHFPSGLHLSHLETNKDQLEWHTLESLPYLSGCVRESIRLSGGVISRNPRIAPNEVLKYGSYVIPKGTSVSMTTWHVVHDAAIFPEPEKFRPERWITASPSGKPIRNLEMERWLVAFGKGSRQCAGINLAFTELYLTFAALFRSFDMELYETDLSDVKVQHAYMVPYPRWDTKGVRVKIAGIRE